MERRSGPDDGGGVVFWGARVFAIESFYVDSSAILGLALVLVGLAQL